MSVYHKFSETDVLYSVLAGSPRVSVVSGSAGWRGNVGPSASINLLDGLRSKENGAVAIRPIYRLNTYSTDGLLYVSGSYPASASISVVKIRPDQVEQVTIADNGVVTSRDKYNWGDLHWSTINNLYSYYSRFNPDGFQTGSYDNYCVFFAKGNNTLSHQGSTYNLPYSFMSSSWTMEVWAKPFQTASYNSDFYIFSKRDHFALYITGSTGQLVFSGSDVPLATSSFGPVAKQWSHIVVRSQNGTGSFLVNLQDAGSFSSSLTLPFQQNHRGLFVGNKNSNPLASNIEDTAGTSVASGSYFTSFNGFINELRFWSCYRTNSQISSSYKSPISTGSSGLVVYFPLNQGPRNLSYFASSSHTYWPVGSASLPSVWQATGSNAAETIYPFALSFGSYDLRPGPLWHPSDNPSFYRTKSLAPSFRGSDKLIFESMVDLQGSSTIQANGLVLKAIHVPSIFYGNRIATGSVELICSSFTSASHGLRRVLRDDGRGVLYLSGSACSSSLEGKVDYEGVKWNAVGNVFYAEGLILIKDPSLIDFGEEPPDQATNDPGSTLSISFRGETRTPTNIFMCRLGSGEGNASNNPSFSRYNPQNGKYELVGDSTTWITAVGLYNKDRRLVAVAKLASPVRKREKDKINIRLKMDF